jgi:putative aldouronate transport system permease protein
MMLPGAIWLILIRYLPMFGIIIAFNDYRVYSKAPSLVNNIIHSKWNGIENFRFMFSTTDAFMMIRNTLGYNVFWIFITLVVSVTFAILLNEVTKKFAAKIYQTLMFFPYFLSWVIVSYFLFAFLAPGEGLIVNFAENTGLAPMNWYNNPTYWPQILTISNLWKNVGYSCILYLAAITGIDATQSRRLVSMGQASGSKFGM